MTDTGPRGLTLISWLTVSNQIVKSLSLCYKKCYFLNMVQPIDINFRKVIEMIQQNIFNRADQYFQLITSPVLNPEIPYKMQT